MHMAKKGSEELIEAEIPADTAVSLLMGFNGNRRRPKVQKELVLRGIVLLRKSEKSCGSSVVYEF